MIVGLSGVLLILCASSQIQLMLFGALTLAASDIAIRYDSVYLDLVGKPIFENGWFLGIALAVTGIAMLRHKSTEARRAEAKFFFKFHSVRAITIGLIFLGLCAFWLGISIYFKTIHNADQVSASLLVLLFAFGFSLIAGHFISRNLSILAARISQKEPVFLAGLSDKLPQEISILSNYLLDVNSQLSSERDNALQMVSVTVHDLKAPIEALKTSGEFMQAHMEKNTSCNRDLESADKLLKMYLESFENVVDRLKDETKRLKRLETIGHSLNRAVTIAKTIYPTHNIKFKAEKNIEVIPVVGLGEVVGNLLNNSVEASSALSPIEVQAVPSTDGSEIVIEVKDIGVGIPKAILEKLRRGKPYTTKPNGNGIGLSSLKSWALERGYGVEIDSSTTVGVSGTTVRISIPTSPMSGEVSTNV